MDSSGALKSKGRTIMSEKRETGKRSGRMKKRTAKVSLRLFQMQIFHHAEAD